ncbi:hypothetical protein LIER_06353 [Lithospermum erythrorhizon]|uniref:Uncharacterized protein n=1 Tax=Lithospermum erythrorhizon TaxID=34254 RepID=A0AAV3P487_LITER
MSAKQKVSDVGAAAKCSMEKTKATIQAKGKKMSTRDPVRKDLAKHKKEVKIGKAELQKQAEYAKNAAEKHVKHATT